MMQPKNPILVTIFPMSRREIWHRADSFGFDNSFDYERTSIFPHICVDRDSSTGSMHLLKTTGSAGQLSSAGQVRFS